MPSPITFPLSGPVKWMLRVTPWAFYAGEYLFDQINDDAPDDLLWHRLVMVFSRATPVGTTEDLAMCTFDLLNFTDGDVDSSWVTGDFTTAEAAFDTYWAAQKVSFSDEIILKEYRWYRRQFAASMTDIHRFEDSGPPARITPKGVAGTSTGKPYPYQVAISITERTADPKHWGRWYLPSPSLTALGTTDQGRISSGDVDAFKTNAAALMNTLWNAQLPLIVPTTQVNKQLVKGWMSVNSIQVDDIPDVQRRRRARQASYRAVGPLT